MALEFLFGRRKTPQELLRQNQRALNRAMRDLDRERAQMENQEKRIIADIKKMAKQGQMVSYYSLGERFGFQNFVFSGCGESHGERSRSYSTIRQEIYDDAGEYSSGFVEDSNFEISRCDGTSDERRHEGHDFDE